MNWQPIETAPKDVPVLLYFPPGQKVTGWRHTGPLPRGNEGYPPMSDPSWKKVEEDGDEGIWLCSWDGGDDEETDFDWALENCDDAHYNPRGKPSHWMPLPEPPAYNGHPLLVARFMAWITEKPRVLVAPWAKWKPRWRRG